MHKSYVSVKGDFLEFTQNFSLKSPLPSWERARERVGKTGG